MVNCKTLYTTSVQNYQLVSGLCFMSKLERVVKQLMQHINSNNLDNPRQSSYKSGHSTETALLHIKNKIHLSLSRGKPTALVFLIVLSHGLVCVAQSFNDSRPISATNSKQLKLGQPSLNCVSCCSEYHKTRSLVLCCSPYTPLL